MMPAPLLPLIALLPFLLLLGVLLWPALLLTLQLGAALFARAARRPPARATSGGRPRIAVLVPAHNEALGIGATLASIAAQLAEGDRLLVVADNCSDATAVIARAHGVETLERHEPARRGKGYALDAGVRHLAQAPPQVLVVIDADCLLAPHALTHLGASCRAQRRPAQALYLMRAKPGATPATRVAEFAWIVRNWLRPLGCARLGLPCQLMGTGMAFPWEAISAAPLASGAIVEDLALGLDLAAVGLAPRFCPQAQVLSEFPDNQAGARSQRTRWEHGHLDLLLRQGPRLLFKALRERNGALLFLAADLCVPPLGLLVLASTALALLGAALAAACACVWPWALGGLPLLLVVLTLVAAWFKAGRRALPPRALAHVALYLLRKLPLYAAFVLRRQREWIASSRDQP
ncbi:MAG: glycosyltransferase family 2 protein [Pseudomonadota bacterium]